MGYFVVKESYLQLKKNSFLLLHDNWNDYWEYETTYSLYYFPNDYSEVFLGEVKIGDVDLDEDSKRRSPNLPSTFDTLDKGFFSVGQAPDYYKKIYNYLDKMPINPFEALNDMAYNLELLDLYINKDVLKFSLLRSVSLTMIKR